MQKCQCDGKGLGKDEYGIIDPILNEGKFKRTSNISFEESTPTKESSTPTIQHVNTNEQGIDRDIFNEWLHYHIMNRNFKEL